MNCSRCNAPAAFADPILHQGFDFPFIARQRINWNVHLGSSCFPGMQSKRSPVFSVNSEKKEIMRWISVPHINSGSLISWKSTSLKPDKWVRETHGVRAKRWCLVGNWLTEHFLLLLTRVLHTEDAAESWAKALSSERRAKAQSESLSFFS